MAKHIVKKRRAGRKAVEAAEVYRRIKWGVEVRKILLDRGMTQKELANLVDVNINWLGHLLHGRRPGNECRKSISKLLGINPKEYKII